MPFLASTLSTFEVLLLLKIDFYCVYVCVNVYMSLCVFEDAERS